MGAEPAALDEAPPSTRGMSEGTLSASHEGFQRMPSPFYTTGEVNRHPCYNGLYGLNHRKPYRHHAGRLRRKAAHCRPPDSGPGRGYLA